MPWTRRDNESAAMKQARLEDWVEMADGELFGKDGEKGVVREFREDKSFIRGALGLLLLLGGGDFVFHILHVFGITH